MKVKVEDTGVFSLNAVVVNETIYEWIDAEEFSLAELAKQIGIDLDHKVKVKIVLQVVLEPCLYCGKPATGQQLCDRCHAVVCDACAKLIKTENEANKRLCPLCHNKIADSLTSQ